MLMEGVELVQNPNTRRPLLLVFVFIAVLSIPAIGRAQSSPAALRPPATPLVTHDPYFSIWSMADKLTDGPTKHWTGETQEMNGIIRVDRRCYRFLGTARGQGQAIPTFDEVSQTITPTRTIVVMTSPEIELRVEF